MTYNGYSKHRKKILKFVLFLIDLFGFVGFKNILIQFKNDSSRVNFFPSKGLKGVKMTIPL